MDPPPAPMNAAAKLPMISEISHEQPIVTTKKSSHALKYWNSVGSLVIEVVSISNERRVSGERRAEGDERVRCTRLLGRLPTVTRDASTSAPSKFSSTRVQPTSAASFLTLTYQTVWGSFDGWLPSRLIPH